MSQEWQAPGPDDIYKGMLESGRSPFEFFAAAKVVEMAIDNGEVRTKIDCLEHIQGFFEMANRMYIKNSAMDMKDAELGIHMASCRCPLCKKLGQFYFEELRVSSESDSPQILSKLQSLAKEIMLGKERHELVGRKSKFYDSVTGGDLFETKVVEITDKCIDANQKDRQILLCYIPYSGGTMIEVQDSVVSQVFNIEGDLMSGVTKDLEHRARVVGMDPNLFRAIIIANSPKTKLLSP